MDSNSPDGLKTAVFRFMNKSISIKCFPHDNIFKTLSRGEIWETHNSYFLANKALKPDSVFFDIGANVGYYSIIGALLLNAGQVVAVEPHPRIFDVLKNNLSAYLSDRVHLENVALGEANGMVGIDFSDAESGQTHVNKSRSDVRMTTLDDLSAQYGYPTVIKMDVEGLEADVLYGGRKTLTDGRPSIVMEFAPQNAGRSRYSLVGSLRWLEKKGYQIYFFRGHSGWAAEPISADVISALFDYWISIGHPGHMDLMISPPD